MIAWINGRRARAIDHRDRGFQYGDGLFETMRIKHGRIRLLDHHMERLQGASRRLQIALPGIRALRREIERAGALRAHGVLKLIVTRGIGPRGYRPSGALRSTRVLSSHVLPRATVRASAQPVRIRVCSTPLSMNARLAGLKTLNRLDCVLARAEWSDARIWDGLMCDIDGNIVCGTMSNLFLTHGRQLITPRLDRCGVAGVMRRWVLEQAAGLGLQPVERRVRWADVRRAAEMFMTNAVAGVVSVAAVQNRRRHTGEFTRDLADRLRSALDLL